LYNLVADWAQALDKNILEKANWKYIQVGGGNKAAWKYQISRIRFAVYRLVNEKISVKLLAEKAHARCYNALLECAIKLNADWYIGHNPGAMAIAANAAKKTSAKAGFDFEDYHRGEYVDFNSPALKRQIFIEDKYVTKFNHISVASSIIGVRVKDVFPFISPLTILNCFPKYLQPSFNVETKKELSLFWFSQHIGKDRGLEIVIDAIKELNDDDIKLNLLGNCSEDVKNYIIFKCGSLGKNIYFKGVIDSDDIPLYAAKFDIGLALEMKEPLNRDICLTNKLFTYLLSGNAIIFSETTMQKNFNEEYHVGLSFPINNKQALKECILFYKNKKNLFNQREHNYQLAKEKLNWENEAKKILAIIK
jgi:glycosyltransferase involved in cell wall biosynthesis